jgi:predicted RNA-binding Zn-ribbon protein involved in translation (DUF1610 family)
MRQFVCDNCGKQSRFLADKRKTSFFAELKTTLSADETRSYDCEHCGTENRIEQPAGAWAVIDADAKP